jgi:mannose-6-phosphate isomerase
MPALPPLLSLEPEYRDYVWGGRRLKPPRRIAEAWVVHAGNRVRNAPLAGRTLAEVAAQYGAELLGAEPSRRSAGRFPLLLKLLDCREWLSLQVHPDDAQAVRLEGPGAVGKTEAWHILEADPGAELIAGWKPGVARGRISECVGKRDLLDLVQRLPMAGGDTVLIRAGVLHALGPGLIVYEIQQSSDLTYRVYDWDRPAADNRKLHLEQSLAVLDPSAAVRPVRRPDLRNGERRVLCESEYFRLETIRLQGSARELDPEGESFHLVTVAAGRGEIEAGAAGGALELYETALLPACAGRYSLRAEGEARFLLVSVPPGASKSG